MKKINSQSCGPTKYLTLASGSVSCTHSHRHDGTLNTAFSVVTHTTTLHPIRTNTPSLSVY